ncbi:MAG TPA: tyrosine-type recombinase/integrase [Acidocella sp.]|nr:tyrosine-type recombinase/integrase [Acidocella sp.]
MIEALGESETLNDPTLPGFFVRRQGKGTPSFVVMYRNVEGRQRKVTIGRYGMPWTADLARKEAFKILHQITVEKRDVAQEKKNRKDAPTIAEVCKEYIEEAEAGRLLTKRGKTKRASTLASDKSRIQSHIIPLLGSSKFASITHKDVAKFMFNVAEGKTAKREKMSKKRALSNVRGGKGAATRTVGLLGAIFTFGIKQGYRADNPVTGTVKYADGQKDRRLADEEYLKLGKALTTLETGTSPMWPAAAAAIRFLLASGWRKSEVLELRRGEVNFHTRTAKLSSTKNDTNQRVLSKACIDLLKKRGDAKAGSLFFPPARGEGVMSGFPSYFERVCKEAGLGADVTPHVARHSYISVANDLGYTEATIGLLVGHKGASVTRGYIHGVDSVLLAACDKIANSILTRMGTPITESVVEFPQNRSEAAA